MDDDTTVDLNAAATKADIVEIKAMFQRLSEQIGELSREMRAGDTKIADDLATFRAEMNEFRQSMNKFKEETDVNFFKLDERIGAIAVDQNRARGEFAHIKSRLDNLEERSTK